MNLRDRPLQGLSLGQRKDRRETAECHAPLGHPEPLQLRNRPATVQPPDCGVKVKTELAVTLPIHDPILLKQKRAPFQSGLRTDFDLGRIPREQQPAP